MNEDATKLSAFDRLRVELARCPFHEFLRPAAIAADDAAGTVTVRLVNRPEFRAMYGSDMIHGGIIASLIDMTGHAVIAIGAGRPTPTVDLRIDYLKPASGAHLDATARVLRLGRTLGRADIDVRDDKNAVVAMGRGTFAIPEGPKS